MAELAAHLKSHFEVEEEGGFFTQVVARAPRLADQVGQLSDEHKSMTKTVESLCIEAANGDGSAAWWEKNDADFHRLSKELMQHENHENQILQDAYTEDIGSDD
jgi:hypothetical protein